MEKNERKNVTAYDRFKADAAQEYFVKTAAAEIAEMDEKDFQDVLAGSSEEMPVDALERSREKMARYIKWAQRKNTYKRRLKQGAKIAVALVLVSCTLFTFSYTTVDAARIAINNFFLEKFDDRTIVHTQLPSSTEQPQEQRWVEIAWLPDGYSAITQRLTPVEQQYYFEGNGDCYLNIVVRKVEAKAPAFDTEDAEDSEIDINGISAMLYYKKSQERYILIFLRDDYILYLDGVMEKEDLVEIAKNIVII